MAISDRLPNAPRPQSNTTAPLERPATRDTTTGAPTASAPAAPVQSRATSPLDQVTRSRTSALDGGRAAAAPIAAPPVRATADSQAGAEVFAENFTLAMNNATTRADGTRIAIDGLSPNDLVAAFMRLNIFDTSNGRQARDELASALHELRQLRISNAQREAATARQQLTEAEKAAGTYDKDDQGVGGRNLGAFKTITSSDDLLHQWDASMQLDPVIGAGSLAGDVLGIDGELRMWLDPAGGLHQGVEQGKQEQVEIARKEVENATRRADQADSITGRLLRENARGDSRGLQQVVDRRGLPIDGSAQRLRTALEPVSAKLLEVAGRDGVRAMFDAMPALLDEALLPALQDMGATNPEATSARLSLAYTRELYSKLAPGRLSMGVGLSTLELGQRLDPETSGASGAQSGARAIEDAFNTNPSSSGRWRA